MSHIKVGKADVQTDTPRHVWGIQQGNGPRRARRQVGHAKDGTVDARRSTGIAPKEHNAILKAMPNLPPG